MRRADKSPRQLISALVRELRVGRKICPRNVQQLLREAADEMNDDVADIEYHEAAARIAGKAEA